MKRLIKYRKDYMQQMSQAYERKNMLMQSQLNTHFLFNSLNVLSGLIEENTSKAQEFTESLAFIYRYVLEYSEEVKVSAQDELDFATTYLELMKMRFEGSLDYTLSVSKDMSPYFVVPFSLQILIENCIKHNKISTSHPLAITIEVEKNLIRVTNPIEPKSQQENTSGFGLQYLSNQYQRLSGTKPVIQKKNNQFIVEIPLLTQNTIIMKQETNIDHLEYLEAKERVEEKQGFYWHLVSFILVNIFLIVLNLVTSPNHIWFVWPLLGWGIGLTSHGIRVFAPFRDTVWQENQIRKEVERRRQEREKYIR